VPVPQADLDRIRGLYDRGLNLQAYRCAMTHGRLPDWSGTAERILAGRLAYHLGAPRLAAAMHLSTWRSAPTDPEAYYFAGVTMADRRGAWEAWRFLHDFLVPDDCPDQVRAHFLALRARLAAQLRDFDTAETALEKAVRLAPGDLWLEVTRSVVLLVEDRGEEALGVAREALKLQPSSPHAVIVTAQALTVLGQEREALELLLDASLESESSMIVSFLINLQLALEDHRGSLESLDRLQALSPMAETAVTKHLAAQRSEAHYACGDTAAAIRFAREADTPFFTAIAERLESAEGGGKRVMLPVGFVKQHHATCAPATLTAISRFWSRDAEHVEVAEEICYDGTPTHSERAWAERHGWLAREFTVTSNSAVALLDRGIPFTLTHTGPTAGHLQAVIGYDIRRGTLLVRDPSFPNIGEFLSHEMLEVAKSTGPRGMAIVPDDRPYLLDDIDLPDADLWDRAHAIQTALEAHDRSRARETYREMSLRDTEHIVTLYARRALAAYDGDNLGLLALAEEMLRRFRDDPRLQLAKLGCLSGLERENESLEFLETVCGKDCHPALQVALAMELGKDARRHDEARRILRRVLRNGHVDAEGLRTLGNLEWNAGRFEDALELYRFAACLGDKDERLAMNYFLASSSRERSAEAERFLERRAKRLGSRSPLPLITLGEAYWNLGQPGRAIEALEEALELHPEDPDLLIGAAGLYSRCGRHDRIEAMLSRAEPRAKRTDWMRAAAALATDRDDLEAALDLWRRVIEIEPLAVDGHAGVARLLATTRGPRDAIEHLEATCSRFPHNVPVQKLRVEWLLEHDRKAAETALVNLVETTSVNTWARLWLALLLGERGRIREARAEAELACLLDPTDSWSHVVLARLWNMDRRDKEAAAAFEKAIRLWVGSEAAIQGLFALCRSDDDRRRALDLVREEILRQVSAGDAPLLFRAHAQDLLAADELLTDLKELLEVRPDHRRLWTATVDHLIAMNRIDEAREVGERCVERFPLELRAWLDLARVRMILGDIEDETRALQQSLHISPGNGFAHRRLSEIARLNGRDQEARQQLEAAIAASPLDAINHGWLAELLWEAGERTEALSRLETALGLEPAYEWARNALRVWSEQSDDRDRAVAFARTLCRRRAGDVRAWLLLSHTLASDDRLEERLAAVDRAIALAPRSVEAYDRRATMLAEVGRFKEALDSCRPAVYGDDPPVPLRGRASWIEAETGFTTLAIGHMRAIVKENPGYTWGWYRLAEWYRDSGAEEDYLEAAENLVLLTAGEPASLETRGHAKLVNGDLEGAESDLCRALELEPGNVAIGQLLFDTQLDTNAIDAAERTLEGLRRHLDRATVLAFQVRLSAARLKPEEVTGALTELLTLPEIDESDIEKIVDEAWDRWPKRTDRLMDKLLERPGVHPAVGALWVRIRARGRRWRAVRKRIERLPAGEEITRRAIAALMEGLARSYEIGRLRRYLRRRRAVLQADPVLWGTAIHALANRGQWSFTVRWAGRWQGREGLEPWILFNLAHVFRKRGNHEEAVQINQRAMMLARDHTTQRHALWLAVEEAIAGEQAVADTYLSMVPRAQTGLRESFLVSLARAARQVSDIEGSVRAGSFARAAKLLAEARSSYPAYRKERDLRSVYRRCVWSIGRRYRGARRMMWLLRSARG